MRSTKSPTTNMRTRMAVAALALAGCATQSAGSATGSGSTTPAAESGTRGDSEGGLAMQLLRDGGPGAAAVALENRAEVPSGARIGVRVVAEQPAYLYVFHRASSAPTPERLLPVPMGQATLASAQSPVVLPGEGSFYTLDNGTGKEVFFAAASRAPLDDAALTALAGEALDEREPPTVTIKDRGLGPVYRMAMDERGMAKLWLVLLHK